MLVHTRFARVYMRVVMSDRRFGVHPAFAGPVSSIGLTSSPLDQTGSLLRMFKSEGFDAPMHISYLFKMANNEGVQDYLTNELYHMSDIDFDFYLSELCLMALSRPKHEKLHAFLLDKAASRMYYAVKIHWLFQSAVEDSKPPLGLLENAMKLYQESEMAVVNSRVYTMKVLELRKIHSSAPGSPMRGSGAPPSPHSSDGSASRFVEHVAGVPGGLDVIRSLSRHVVVEATGNGLYNNSGMYRDIGDAIPSSTSHWRACCEGTEWSTLDAFMLKQLRCDYFNLQNSFVSQLTILSNSLVNCSSSAERRKSLNLSLAQINHWLFDRRLAIAVSGGTATYMTGVSLPIPLPTNEFTHILKVHVDDCKVFRTRQRAPYLLTVEVVDFSDLMTNGELMEDLLRGELSGVGTDEDDLCGNACDTCENFEQFLKKVSPRQISKMIYPETLVGENRRASIAPGGGEPGAVDTDTSAGTIEDEPSIAPTPGPAPVIIVDDANVSVVPVGVVAPNGVVGRNSRKALKRATIQLRRKLWGELNEDRIETIRSESVYGHLPSWRIQKIIVKGGDDVRQEILAGQLVSMFKRIFHSARLPLWLRPYEVVVTSANSGLIEMIPNTISIDGLKKEFANCINPLTNALYGVYTLDAIFPIVFADHVEEAQLNFIESCAAYCVVSYLLQIKDRHNGNLLLDSDGHLIHIDFGFMLANAPGGSFALETSPFKLTQEYLDVMGGEYSNNFETFRTLIIRAFLEARKHRDQILSLVRIVGECNPKLPCFAPGVETTISQMSERFCVNLTEEMCIEKIVGLIDESLNNWRTIQYDNFQRITNGIL